MSCGNRFQCALTKSSRVQFAPDKPSNPQLYNENQKRLNELLKAREEINNLSCTSNKKQTESIPFIDNVNTNSANFTPWKIPSSSDYQLRVL